MGKKYEDADWLFQKYVLENESCRTIADMADTSARTISRWLDRHDIDARSNAEANRVRMRRERDEPFSPSANSYSRIEGYEYGEKFCVQVHRLIAAAKYGTDAIRGKHVHHIDGNPWNNSWENIAVMTNGEHQEHHNSPARHAD